MVLELITTEDLTKDARQTWYSRSTHVRGNIPAGIHPTYGHGRAATL